MDKVYLKDNYVVTELDGITAVFPKNYSSYSENASGFYINSIFPVNNQRTAFIEFTRVTSVYNEAGTVAYSIATLRSFLLTNTGFKSPSGGSGGVWGSITGTLSDQTDLQTALNAKQNTLVSGTNIKTINFTSLLGSGDVAVQPTLVSGTNIKTINGTSLLGSGDITVGGGITVGTTAVTSGTDGMVFFQAGGVVQQDSAFFWDNTNKRLGIGATPSTSVRLDVRAQGTLSTDIAFRVRNSADTFNSFQVNGLSQVWSNGRNGISSNTAFGSNVFGSITGGGNSAFGDYALQVVTSGIDNTGLGKNAGFSVTYGSNNTYVGRNAGAFDTGDGYNTLIGSRAGESIAFSVGYNTIIGAASGNNITTGSRNTLLGASISGLSNISNNVIITDGNGVSGVALWKNASNFVGIGYNPTTATLGARLDVRAQGALSTDIAFRVRNSADSANLVRFNGNGTHFFFNSTGSTNINFYEYGHGIWANGGSNFRIKNLNGSSVLEGTTFTRLLTDVTSLATTFDGRQLHIGNTAIPTINGTNSIVLENGTAPTTAISDRFYLYSADIVAGNAAPHFRTENGSIIKLFKGAALTASDGTLANAVTRIAELEARLQAHGLIA